MTRQTLPLSAAVLGILTASASGQSLIGLRLEGPEEVIEETVTYYSVIAEFDNGMEWDVTLSAFMWTVPGIYAEIGVFGDLEAFAVEEDQAETIWAFYSFGTDSEMAWLEVTILDVPPPGLALDFDGSDDLVRVQRSESLEPADELTVEVWIRPDSGGSFHSRIVRIAGDFAPGYTLAWQQSGDNRVQLIISQAVEGSVVAEDNVPTSTYFGEWHHIAGVYSATGDYCRLYVDGVLKDSQPGVGILQYSGSDLGIGNFWAASNEDFDGVIDEVRIWSVARTECQIRRHMHRPLYGNEPGLVGYWRFDEREGQYAFDSSPYGNHGVLGNDDDPAGDDADPLWLISEADLNDPPFGPLYWTTPEMVEEISSGEEWNVAISADQLEVYIGSERDGFAESEIYRAVRSSADEPFSMPVVVWELSIPGYRNHENIADISADGLRIYFNRHYWLDPADFYMSERDSPEAPWGIPVPIDSLNTDASEYDLAVSGDELFAVFTSSRSGENRYWTASRSSVEEQWASFVLIDALDGFEPRGCGLSLDGLTLYVTAEGPTGFGSWDVWRLTHPSTAAQFGEPVHVPQLSSDTHEWDISISGDGRSAYLVSKRSRLNSGSVFVSYLTVPGDEAEPDGDVSIDGLVNGDDTHWFIELLFAGESGDPERIAHGDFDCTGVVDIDDIEPFVMALLAE
jgi:hypothetical protein